MAAEEFNFKSCRDDSDVLRKSVEPIYLHPSFYEILFNSEGTNQIKSKTEEL
jgi:hypothetical protein